MIEGLGTRLEPARHKAGTLHDALVSFPDLSFASLDLHWGWFGVWDRHYRCTYAHSHVSTPHTLNPSLPLLHTSTLMHTLPHILNPSLPLPHTSTLMHILSLTSSIPHSLSLTSSKPHSLSLTPSHPHTHTRRGVTLSRRWTLTSSQGTTL